MVLWVLIKYHILSTRFLPLKCVSASYGITHFGIWILILDLNQNNGFSWTLCTNKFVRLLLPSRPNNQTSMKTLQCIGTSLKNIHTTGSLVSKRDNVSSIYRVFELKVRKIKDICNFIVNGHLTFDHWIWLQVISLSSKASNRKSAKNQQNKDCFISTDTTSY